jgi:DNA repair exonuclease SbcCD ATPase subunit
MTVREIDEALAAWKSRLEAAAQNLMDLQAQPTYRRLTGCSGVSQPEITGVTASRVGSPLAEFVHVFEYLELLRETVDRAAALRDDLPIFNADQKLREIEDLLSGPSVRLPAIDVPLEQRSLLDGARNEVCLSPAALLEAMGKTFQSAKDAVIAVDKAWRDLDPALDRTAARIAALRNRGLSSTQIAELEAAERRLSELRAEVKADPLGASADLDSQIRPTLDALESGAAAREQLHREIERGLAAARAKLDRLTGTHREAVDAAEQARIKIAGAASLPAPAGDEKLADLRDWLERLAEKYADGMVDPLVVGLRNWNASADHANACDDAALAASRAAIDSRNELRGRLDALKAKARAYGVAEEDDLAALAHQAEALLYTRPTALDRAAAAVAAYEKSLGAHAR